jgi:pimeloyl-ACP methyl ester carboxylesterase
MGFGQVSLTKRAKSLTNCFFSYPDRRFRPLPVPKKPEHPLHADRQPRRAVGQEKFQITRCHGSFASPTKNNTDMKRIFSLPLIALLAGLLFAYCAAYAEAPHFVVEVKGKGTPLILIHGFTCTGDVWKETVEHYQSRYECHVVTLAGFGTTPPALQPNFLETVKNDLLAYIKTKKLKSPVIMGHSMGAVLSLWAAASAPGTFSKVIAVDGVPFLPALQFPGATAATAKPYAEGAQKAIEAQTREQFKEASRTNLQSMITSPERIEQVSAISSQSDIPTQAQVIYELMTTDLRDAVATIDCPVLLLGAWVAYKNYGTTRESALTAYQAQIAKVPNATLEMSDKAKHFIFYDDPAWFFEKTEAFLNKKS